MTLNPNENDLIHEFIYHKYLINGERMIGHFRDLNTPEYIAMHIIEEFFHINGEDKVYLRDIAERMELPLAKVSSIARKLSDKGLIVWEHEGDGDNGTYVKITEAGRDLVTSQDRKLREYYSKVIEKYGEAEIRQLLQMMKKLEKVIRSIGEPEE